MFKNASNREKIWLRAEVRIRGRAVQSVHHSRASELYDPGIVLRDSLQVRLYYLWLKINLAHGFQEWDESHELRAIAENRNQIENWIFSLF